MQSFSAHWLGNIIIVVVAGAITIACFVAATWMLVRPGERDRRHPKYQVLNDD
ncbi:MAG TPA: hypothetical protein VN677_01465 [Gemmatimonadaceae bacterium]|jgi:hypothetical protein|nr:hypothetical protein [Gemmatimonadaceae bacterium]